MKSKVTERIDIEKVVQVHGGGRFNLIVEASIRARIIKTERDRMDSRFGKTKYYTHKPINQALLEVLENNNGQPKTIASEQV